MTDFVLVHGAWTGAWCWRKVADSLQAAGHRVTAPTLTGLGDRAEELTPEVGLDDHVADVIAAIDQSDAGDIILVGHSYGGMLIPGAAAARSGRVGHVVNVDGFMPRTGETNRELLPDLAAAHFERTLAGEGEPWRLPPRRMSTFGITGGNTRIDSRVTDHPRKSYLDPARVGIDRIAAPGTYLLCTGWPTPFGWAAERAADLGWDVRRLEADHMVLVSAPEVLVPELLRIAAELDAAATERPDAREHISPMTWRRSHT